mmetsp:Transcript_19842/g.38891  ORF Transcript_19842/g.38891 Transcript_19842/m.38891 type:complete len:368 (-) Transcript_19842:384-1487(-)|eukprot:CAMPEP_0171493296 /NCGR_PEP_ID=MMETSP0958-20121227/4886_1 /TAXON_ID=87120 /ORGANISM="Aurantiochytrium limacinum, Strain ATCCMYA-1381" /LENGTH=367 /DNA_ID=CAMNT_0012026909 /DNA_START=107 /DNA_END=1210 /DNA_ORIENTATION=+
MEAALEGGLGGQRVKMGSGDKTEGIAFRTSVIRRVLLGVCAVGLLMATGMAWTYRESIEHRYNLYMERQALANHRIQGEASAIAQKLQLEAALSMQLETKEEVIRLIRRIRGFTSAKIEDALNAISDDKERSKVKIILTNVERYIDSERNDYVKEFDEISERRKSQMKKLHKSQTTALHKLLTRVTDVRLEALEEMLEDLFERMDDSIEVSLPSPKWKPLETLVDNLYQEKLSIQDGVQRFDSDFKPYFEGPGVPQDLDNRIHEAKTMGDLADVLDEIYEGAQFYHGRGALKEIRARWITARDKAENPKLSGREADAAEEFYIRTTVQAVIDVQELVNQDKVPEDFLDFDDLDLEDGNKDDDEEEED